MRRKAYDRLMLLLLLAITLTAVADVGLTYAAFRYVDQTAIAP